MAVQTEREPQTVGELIRFWRNQRRLTQMELALDANLSTKHLSFVETGRSRPSRQLLVHLAQHLDLPIAERNRLLLAGGFAPPYLEQPYDGEVMQPLRESLSRLLEAYEPNPALIVDGLWNLIESNRAASLLWDGIDPELLEPPINMLRLGVHPDGLPRISSMTAACNAPLIHRLKRRSREDADPALAKLIEDVESYLPGEPPTRPATQPVVSLRLQTPLGEVELFTVIATLGAPLDVSAANLAIETFLPMNPESAARLAALNARPDLPEHAPSYPAQVAIGTSISPASTSSSIHTCTSTTAAATTCSPAGRSTSSVASSTTRAARTPHDAYASGARSSDAFQATPEVVATASDAERQVEAAEPSEPTGAGFLQRSAFPVLQAPGPRVELMHVDAGLPTIRAAANEPDLALPPSPLLGNPNGLHVDAKVVQAGGE